MTETDEVVRHRSGRRWESFSFSFITLIKDEDDDEGSGEMKEAQVGRTRRPQVRVDR